MGVGFPELDHSEGCTPLTVPVLNVANGKLYVLPILPQLKEKETENRRC